MTPKERAKDVLDRMEIGCGCCYQNFDREHNLELLTQEFNSEAEARAEIDLLKIMLEKAP